MSVRFSWLRPGGWGRLGVVVSMALLFATPMMWATGVFGTGDDSLRRALVFLFAGLWFGVGVGYGLGWAVRGFVLHTRDHDEDDASPPPRPTPARPAAPHPPSRSGH